VKIKIYVEGGSDHNKALQTKCRRGFSNFISKAGFKDRMPRVVPCGGRRNAYDSFRTAHEQPTGDHRPVLLVDSEGPVLAANPWDHVRARAGDHWERPNGAADDQLHLMVQAMEAWLHADKDALQAYFGQEFRVASLSPRLDIENIPKTDLFSGLHDATRRCNKGEYSKGEHSFEILERIDPLRVRAASPVAERLFQILDRLSGQ
jgi:hypothetical protein